MEEFDTSTETQFNFDDDTFDLQADIKTSFQKGSFTVYVIEVSLHCRPNLRWEKETRFKELKALDDSLRNIGWVDCTFPEKKWFGKNDREFIVKRQNQLQNYLQAILHNFYLNSCGTVREFFYPNSQYLFETEEIVNAGMQQIALTLRSEPRFSFNRFLPQIGMIPCCNLYKKNFILSLTGWRRRKVFALAMVNSSNTESVAVSWTERNQKFGCFDNEISRILQWLSGQKHPIYLPLIFASTTNRASLTIYPVKDPSLRDILWSVAHPLDNSFLQKYPPFCDRRGNLRRGMSAQTFWNITRSIASTFIHFLAHYHSYGMFFANIHAGNILVDLKPNKFGVFQCRLSEAINPILGVLPPFYINVLEMGNKVVRTVFDLDMASIGILLKELIESQAQEWNVPSDIAQLTDLLCPPNSNMPSASELLINIRQNPLYSRHISYLEETIFPNPGKEITSIYRKARANFERRLSLHQAVYYQVNAVQNVRKSLSFQPTDSFAA